MITRENYSVEHIMDLHKSSKRDPNLIERVLFAFAPHTTGVLIDTRKDLEIMKQMFDVYSLINVFDDFNIVYGTYYKIVEDEIAYRGIDVTAKEVLMDTYQASV